MTFNVGESTQEILQPSLHHLIPLTSPYQNVSVLATVKPTFRHQVDLSGKLLCPSCNLISFPCAGDYVIVETIAEGHRVTAEIIHILYPVQIKHLKEQKLW